VLLLIFYGWMLAASTGAIVALASGLVFSRALSKKLAAIEKNHVKRLSGKALPKWAPDRDSVPAQANEAGLFRTDEQGAMSGMT